MEYKEQSCRGMHLNMEFLLFLSGEAAPHSRICVIATCTYQPGFNELLLVLQNSEWRIANIEPETCCLISVVKVLVSSLF